MGPALRIGNRRNSNGTAIMRLSFACVPRVQVRVPGFPPTPPLLPGGDALGKEDQEGDGKERNSDGPARDDL